MLFNVIKCTNHLTARYKDADDPIRCETATPKLAIHFSYSQIALTVYGDRVVLSTLHKSNLIKCLCALGLRASLDL